MEPSDVTVGIDRALFFQIGRALQRGIGKRLLGEIELRVSGDKLTIHSQWGGGELVCSREKAPHTPTLAFPAPPPARGRGER